MRKRNSIISVTKVFFFGLAISLLAFSGCKNKTGNIAASAIDSTREMYTCPMHPQKIENHPGDCPICGMALVKKENASRELTQIDLGTLLKPANNIVVSSVPVTTVQLSQQQLKVEALGSIEYDTRFIKIISARISGRIEKLYIKYRYQHVNAGDKIMDIYSPELLTAQQNLLFLIKSDPANTTIINAAKQRLLLLGMSSGQLQEVVSNGKPIYAVSVYSNYTGHVHEAGSMNNLSEEMNTPGITQGLSIREGMYVERSQPIFQVNNMENSWVTLNLFAGDNSLIKAGTPVTIIPETAPDKKFQSKINFIEPFYRNNSKTLTARIYFNNSKLMIPIGSQVKATIYINTGFNNWLPQEAVLSLGINKVVLLKEGNAFKVHTISTGITANDLIQVTDGLTNGDSVAANAQFLMDSESFLKVK